MICGQPARRNELHWRTPVRVGDESAPSDYDAEIDQHDVQFHIFCSAPLYERLALTWLPGSLANAKPRHSARSAASVVGKGCRMTSVRTFSRYLSMAARTTSPKTDWLCTTSS